MKSDWGNKHMIVELDAVNSAGRAFLLGKFHTLLSNISLHG